MLQITVEFPFPGSTALFDNLRWRIHQLVGDDAVIMREGSGASLSRRAPVADLVDPKLADANALIAMTDLSESTARIALFTAGLLRDRNEVALRELGQLLTDHARAGRVPKYQDNSHLTRIMRRLGWKKDGYVGEGYERSPLYRRVAQQDASQC